MITGGVGYDVSPGNIGPIVKTLLPVLLYFPKSGVVRDGAFLLDVINGSPQERPYVLQRINSGRHSIGGFKVLGSPVPRTGTSGPPTSLESGMLAEEPEAPNTSWTGISP
jgi:hypothetical protein